MCAKHQIYAFLCLLELRQLSLLNVKYKVDEELSKSSLMTFLHLGLEGRCKAGLFWTQASVLFSLAMNMSPKMT